MEQKRKPDSPALRLFIATPEIVNVLRQFERSLVEHRTELLNIDTPTLDPAGLAALRNRIRAIFPDQREVSSPPRFAA